MRQAFVPLPFYVLQVPAFQPHILAPQAEHDFHVKGLPELGQHRQVAAHADILVAQDEGRDRVGFCIRLGLQPGCNILDTTLRREQLVHHRKVPPDSVRQQKAAGLQRIEIGMQEILNRCGGCSMSADMQVECSGHGGESVLLRHTVGVLCSVTRGRFRRKVKRGCDQAQLVRISR